MNANFDITAGCCQRYYVVYIAFIIKVVQQTSYFNMQQETKLFVR